VQPKKCPGLALCMQRTSPGKMLLFYGVLCEKATCSLFLLAQIKNYLYLCLAKKYICLIKLNLKV